MADLSGFYQHAMSYSSYVGLAYGIAAVALFVLVGGVVWQSRSLKNKLKSLEKFNRENDQLQRSRKKAA